VVEVRGAYIGEGAKNMETDIAGGGRERIGIWRRLVVRR
jgi:hypothetical protein